MNEPTVIEELLDIIFRLCALLFRLAVSGLLWLVYTLPVLVAGFFLQFWMLLYPKAESIFMSRSKFPQGGFYGIVWMLVNGVIALLAITVVGGLAFAIQYFWGKIMERLFARWIPSKFLSRVWKIRQVDPTTQIKSVGEVMVIGRTFKKSLQKYLRSLEIGHSSLGGDGKPWRIGTEVYGDRDILPRDVISRKLSVPNAERIFFIRQALRAGFTIDEILNFMKIDRWFLVQDFEEEVARVRN